MTDALDDDRGDRTDLPGDVPGDLPADLPPDGDALFLRFFDRWYRDADRERKGFPATRPDLLPIPAHAGQRPADLSLLTDEMQQKVHDQIARMVAAARNDWKAVVGRFDVLSREGLGAIDAAFDEPSLRALLSKSDPGDFGNDLLVTVCELGAVLGEALRAARPPLQWVPDWPYWESWLLDARTGHVIPPFHWAMKRFSRQGLAEDLVVKIGAGLELLRQPAGRSPGEPHRNPAS